MDTSRIEVKAPTWDAASALELEVALLQRLDALVLHDVARALEGGQDLVHALELALGLV